MIVLGPQDLYGFAVAPLNREAYVANLDDNTVPYQRRRILPRCFFRALPFARIPRDSKDRRVQLKGLGHRFDRPGTVPTLGAATGRHCCHHRWRNGAGAVGDRGSAVLVWLASDLAHLQLQRLLRLNHHHPLGRDIAHNDASRRATQHFNRIDIT